ncbi:MAG: DinB family protein [Robiginitalea sp.]|nr:DinB family protein [Robiginitalea sp.]
MRAYLQQLFDYNYYCNKTIIDACSKVEEPPQRTRELFSHILNAHHIWNARILGETPKLGVWELHELPAWQDLHYENQRNSFGIITNTATFDSRIVYENTEGRSFSNALQDILFHIVNHSTHHRGQITVDFRTHGLEPPQMDYILYKR